MILFGTGLLASSFSSLLRDFAILGSSTRFVMGFLDGLSVVAFVGAIFFLIRGREAT